MIQAVACNRLHTLEERCCRWLLGVHDRLGRARFELKVRFLARAMGVKNSAVAGIMASLEDQGLASHDGSSVTILDSIGLRRLACRCYDAMKRWYTLERLAAQPKAEATAPRRARLDDAPRRRHLHAVRLVDASSAPERP